MSNQKKEIIIVGYSGHSYEPIEILLDQNFNIHGYCEKNKIKSNPYKLKYLGFENKLDLESLTKFNFFICIGDNQRRLNVSKMLRSKKCNIINVIHSSANISNNVVLGSGIFISKGVNINANSNIGNDVILNTSSIVEHDCKIFSGAHIAPGSVICGNVEIGKGSLVGANSVINPNLKIGSNVIIGSGSIVTKNFTKNQKIFGAPAKNYEK